MPVGDAAGGPAFEEMAAAGPFGGVDDAAVLTFAGADEEDEAAAFGDAGDDAAGAAEVGGGDVEGDDVDAGADAEDVAAVERVPEGGRVAQVGLGGEEEGERDFGGGGRGGEEGLGGVMGRYGGAEAGG